MGRQNFEKKETCTQQEDSYEQWLCHLGDVLLDLSRKPLALLNAAHERLARQSVRRCTHCRRSLKENGIWTQQGKTYEQWLCQVGDVLLDQCKDPLLLALQKVARRRPAMMELVMPQLFASLALEGARDGCDLSEILAEQVQLSACMMCCSAPYIHALADQCARLAHNSGRTEPYLQDMCIIILETLC